MRISILRALIRESLLLEDRIQDLIDTDPTGNLWSARELGVTHIGGLTWLKSMIDKNLVGDRGEPIADVAPVVVSFFKQGMSDRLNRAGLPTDIMRYKNPGELRQTIDTLGASKSAQKKAVKQSETDIVYESDTFLVVMPHTTASSIFYGKGTTWCTAATEGMNLFLSYVGSGRGIILYYIIRKDGDSRADPSSKVCLATVKGKPHFSSQHGGLSVDAANNGLTEEKFNSALDDEAPIILDKIVKHTAKIGNSHPAAQQVDKAIANIATWKATTDKLGNDEYNDFISFAFKDRAPSRDILESALNDPRIKNNSKYYIYNSPNFDTALLLSNLEKVKDMWDSEANALLTGLSQKSNITYEELQRAIEIVKTKKNNQMAADKLYQNPNMPTEVLIDAYKNPNNSSYMLTFIASNPSLPDDFIMKELDVATGVDQSPDARRRMQKAQKLMVDISRSYGKHPGFERIIWDAVQGMNVTDYLQKYFHLNVAESIAMTSEDPQFLAEVADAVLNGKLSRYYLGDTLKKVKRWLIMNSVTPDSVIKTLANENYASSTLIMMLAQARLDDPNFSEEDVEEAHKREYPDEYDDDRGDRDYDD